MAPPPDFKPISDSNPTRTSTTTTTTTTRKPDGLPRIPIADNIANFLPPGFKPDASDELPDAIPIADDILSKLLPAGYGKKGGAAASGKLPTTTTTTTPKSVTLVHKFSESAESTTEETDLLNSVLSKVQFKDVSALLPPGFKAPAAPALEQANDDVEQVTSAPKSSKPVLAAAPKGVVFPKGLKRPGSGRITTPAPLHVEGPSQPAVTIRKGVR